MTEEIQKLLDSNVKEDYYLALNMINEDSIKLFDSKELYNIINKKKIDIEIDMSQILRLKRVFSKVDFNFKILDFI